MPACPECKGVGSVLPDQLSHDGSTFDLQYEPCPACEGTSSVLDDPMLDDLQNERAKP